MRTTKTHLEKQIAYLNLLTESPGKPWRRDEGGASANVGNYHLSEAYGGVCIHRMENTGGGVSMPVSFGHVTKRELYERLTSFIAGIETGKKMA